MKVICIKPYNQYVKYTGGEISIRIGDIYDVTISSRYNYIKGDVIVSRYNYIKGDVKFSTKVIVNNFITLAEFRENRINSILN